MTWAYRVNVLDLEPRGPLPPEIYWRRRGLALGIAIVAVGIVIAIIVAVVSSSAGANTTGQVGPSPQSRSWRLPQPGGRMTWRSRAKALSR